MLEPSPRCGCAVDSPTSLSENAVRLNDSQKGSLTIDPIPSTPIPTKNTQTEGRCGEKAEVALPPPNPLMLHFS